MYVVIAILYRHVTQSVLNTKIAEQYPKGANLKKMILVYIDNSQRVCIVDTQK